MIQIKKIHQIGLRWHDGWQCKEPRAAFFDDRCFVT